MIFTAVWALIFSLGKPWLGAAPGKALDGTRARGYRIWAAVSPSSASPRTRKVPLKTGKRGSGYEKANFFFFFLIFPKTSQPASGGENPQHYSIQSGSYGYVGGSGYMGTWYWAPVYTSWFFTILLQLLSINFKHPSAQPSTLYSTLNNDALEMHRNKL